MRLARLVIPFSAAAVLVTGCDVARPVSEATTAVAECARCHGFPPAQPHPQLANATAPECNECHATTVAPDGTIIPGGGHMNGTVDQGHPAGFESSTSHGYAAERWSLTACKTCHGEDFNGGTSGQPSCNACHTSSGYADWQTNCTFCHGIRTQNYAAATLPKAAPPNGPYGETLASDPAVGAHAKHVRGGALTNGFACDTCHTVPTDLTHLDGAAPVTLGGLAKLNDSPASFAGGTCSSVYCHGATLQNGTSTTPTWTTTSYACSSCHGLPPHTGADTNGVSRHEFHVGRGAECYYCHAEVAADSATPGIQDASSARALHVNGETNVSFSPSTPGTWNASNGSCATLCHGGNTMYWRTNP